MSDQAEETTTSSTARPNLIARIFRRRWYVPVVLVALVGAAVALPLLEQPDLAGTYVLNVPQATVTLTLEEDGVARVQPPGSTEQSGTWELDGKEVTIEVPVGNPQVFQLDGDVLIDPNGQRWVKTDGEPVPEVEVTDQPTP